MKSEKGKVAGETVGKRGGIGMVGGRRNEARRDGHRHGEEAGRQRARVGGSCPSRSTMIFPVVGRINLRQNFKN